MQPTNADNAATICGRVFDLASLNREPTAVERRFVDLLSLASDEAATWYGVADDKLTGNWSLATVREIRGIRQREQESLFGRMLVPYDTERAEKPGDANNFTLPPDARPQVRTLAKSQAGPAPAANSAADPASPNPATPTASTAFTNQPNSSIDENYRSSQSTMHDETVVERSIANKLKLDVLGRLPNGYIKVFSKVHHKTSIIRNIGRMTYEELLQIAGPPAREHVLRSNEDDKPDLYPFSDVREAIAILAGYRTIGEETELGVGLWEGIEKRSPDELSVVLVGVGEAAYWNGDKQLHRIDYPRAKGHLLDFESGGKQWYNFDSLSHRLKTMTREDMVKAKEDCVELFSRWKWKSASSPMVATGLLFASFVQSFWEWRPQVAVVGKTNSGKSYLWITLERLLGSLCCKQAKPTEPGLRQSIGNTSKIVLIDEFDKCKNRQSILEFLRLSSRGEETFRGTPGQKAISSLTKNLVWLAGLEAGLTEEADRNRFISLDLERPAKGDFGKLTLPTIAEAAELGERMLAIAILSIERAKPLAIKLRDTNIPGIDTRIVESYAVPAAMLATIDGATDDEAREILRLMLEDLDRQEVEIESDESAVVREMLGVHLQYGTVRLTASQWLSHLMKNDTKANEAKIVLEGYGMKIAKYTSEEAERAGIQDCVQGDQCFAIAHKKIRAILRGTRWENASIDKILTRIPGAIRGRRYFGEMKQHCVIVPMNFMEEEIIGGPESEAMNSAEAAAAVF